MLSSNPAFTSSPIISQAFHQPAPLTAPANPPTQGTQSTQRPLLSIVLFLKNDPRNNLVANCDTLVAASIRLLLRFLRRIRIMLLCGKTVKTFHEKLLDRDARKFALADLRHNCLASGDSKRFVRHLFTVQPDAALLNHPQCRRCTWCQARLFK